VIQRRRYVRANTRIHFLFSLADDNETVFGFVARNISAGGLFVVHDRPMAAGTPIQVEIELNDGNPVAVVDAAIVRSEEIGNGVFGIAIEFTRIAEATRSQLQRFVDQHADDEALPDIERYLLPNYVEELRKLTEDKVRALLTPGGGR
jgi:c-di-GMP-binding flagellar brake protein YcgR